MSQKARPYWGWGYIMGKARPYPKGGYMGGMSASLLFASQTFGHALWHKGYPHITYMWVYPMTEIFKKIIVPPFPSWTTYPLPFIKIYSNPKLTHFHHLLELGIHLQSGIHLAMNSHFKENFLILESWHCHIVAFIQWRMISLKLDGLIIRNFVYFYICTVPFFLPPSNLEI